MAATSGSAPIHARTRGSFAARRARAALLVACTLALTPFVSFASAGDNGIEQVVNGLTLELLVGGDAARTGANPVVLRIHDAGEQPIRQAKVALKLLMDDEQSMDMGKERMVEVELRESASLPGSYEGNATLRYTGMWKVTATVSRASGTDTAAFDLSVTAGGPNWTVIIVFGAAMVTVIVAAALLRSRRAGAKSTEGAKA